MPRRRRPRKSIYRGQTSLEPTARLIRFLHLGNDRNIFITQRRIPILMQDFDLRLSFINYIAALRYSLPFGIIKNVMASYTLRRNDEAFLAIAYCLHCTNNIPASDVCKMKAEIYKDLPQLLKTDYDMFLFVDLSNKVVHLRNKYMHDEKLWKAEDEQFEQLKKAKEAERLKKAKEAEQLKKAKEASEQTQNSETPEAGGSSTIQEVSEQTQDSQTPEAVGSAAIKEVSEQTQDSQTPEAGGSAAVKEVSEQAQDSQTPEAGSSAAIKDVSEQTQDSQTPEAGGSAAIKDVSGQRQVSVNVGESNQQEKIQKTSFGRGMKKALFQWYDQRTALELANMFGRNRGMFGWTHRDIIHMCHMKFDSRTQSDKAQVIDTLFKPLPGKIKKKIRRQTQNSETPEAGGSATIQEVSEQTQDSETPEAGGSATIHEVSEQTQDSETPEAGGSATIQEVSEQTQDSETPEAVERGSAAINEVGEQTQDSETPEAVERGSATINEVSQQRQNLQISEAVKRIIEIRKLRVKNANRFDWRNTEIILRNNLELDQIPAHFLEEPRIWEMLMPTLTYQQLLRIIPTLQSFNFLTSYGLLSRIVCHAICNRRLIARSGVHPLEILAVSHLYGNNARYNEAVKEVHYQVKIVQRLHLRLNPFIIHRFAQAVNYATIATPPTDCAYFVTLDLREMVERKTVLRMSQLTCLEAMVLFALTLKKREKYIQIYTFINKEGELRRVNITKNMTFESALEYCRRLMMERTKQSLLLPFEYVNKRNTDTIFLTIVDSVARFCQRGEAPIDEFRSYRQDNHHFSKFIVLNLRRTSGDLIFSYEKGMMVICGLQPDTWKIIDAFALSKFT